MAVPIKRNIEQAAQGKSDDGGVRDYEHGLRVGIGESLQGEDEPLGGVRAGFTSGKWA